MGNTQRMKVWLYTSVIAVVAAGGIAQAPEYAIRRGGESALATMAVVGDAAMDAALQKFNKLNERRQIEVLESVREAVARLDDPQLRSLRSMAERAGELGKPRYKPLRVGKNYQKSETARRDSSALIDQLGFRSRYEYRWGFGNIAERQTPRAGRRRSKRQRSELRLQLEDLCAGYPIDADKALAGIMRRLDNERSADVHAVFLDSWHNGSETFYQALARTAGSGKGVFCYDAMLTDWTRRCVGKKHPEYKPMIRSLDATQSAFYRMAATYRRYRGLREMVALSLVLPADQRLPERLARLYEDNAGSGYSTRDNIILLLAAHDGDVTATVETVLANLEPMPTDTWHTGFQPVQGIYDCFEKLMPRLVAGGLHTDRILALKKQESKALRRRITQVARAALVDAVG